MKYLYFDINKNFSCLFLRPFKKEKIIIETNSKQEVSVSFFKTVANLCSRTNNKGPPSVCSILLSVLTVLFPLIEDGTFVCKKLTKLEIMLC